MSSDKDEKTKSSTEINLGYFRASVDSSLLLLKSTLILNSGALVSILVVASRSVTEGLASAVVSSANVFMWGLIFALGAILFFAPDAEGIEEFEEQNKTTRPAAIVSAILVFLSCIFFIYGSWSTVSSLEEFFQTG